MTDGSDVFGSLESCITLCLSVFSDDVTERLTTTTVPFLLLLEPLENGWTKVRQRPIERRSRH
jgi:hypothetical protein